MNDQFLQIVLTAMAPYSLRQRNSTQWQARCPVHGGNDKDSLTITFGTSGKVLMHCHSQGCSYKDILKTIGIEAEGVYTTMVDEGIRYVYLDPNGQPLHAQVRGAGKQFHAERWTGTGWEHGAPPDRTWMVPYNLPSVIAAINCRDKVWLVEGEKDADTLALFGLTSTTIANGSSGWRDHYPKWFAGADVVMVPDRDEAGQKFRTVVEQALRGIANSFQVVELPYDITETGGKDVSDWIREGHTIQELEAMISCAWRLDGVMTLDEAAEEDTWFDEVELEHFGMPGLGTGYQVPGIGPGIFMIFAARLGVGKTAWVVDLLSRVLSTSNLKVMVSTYDEPASRLRRYLAAATTLDHRYTDWRMPKRHRMHHRRCGEIAGKPMLLDSRARDINGIEHIARSWRPDLLVVDHLAMITGQEDHRQRLEEASQKLRLLANDLGCCVLALSQLNRPGEDLQFLATSANLYGSDAIGHTADAIICMQRPVSQKRGKVDPRLQLENLKGVATINSWEQYRVLHTVKNRLGPEAGCYPIRLAGAIRKMYPLHKSKCNCPGCREHKEMVEVRSDIEQEVNK